MRFEIPKTRRTFEKRSREFFGQKKWPKIVKWRPVRNARTRGLVVRDWLTVVVRSVAYVVSLSDHRQFLAVKKAKEKKKEEKIERVPVYKKERIYGRIQPEVVVVG